MRAHWRSIAAVIVGLLATTLIVEVIEFALVTAVLGHPSTDPTVYYGVRNRPWFLAIKLVYNTGGAVCGGYLAAKIAGGAARWPAIVLVIVQSFGFVYALANEELRQWMPVPMWIALIVVTAGGILWGARLGANRDIDELQ